jgi:hypothetical protein
MRHFRYCLSTFVSVIVAFGLAACKEQQKQEPPLLLEEVSVTEELSSPTGPVADNSRCHVCHINYEGEELVFIHSQANISCEQCHGASDAHCSDEDNITPPDIMYPANKINSSCKSCHPDGKLSGGKKYCTDCHGEHRLSYRTRKWDKTTGELIEDDKVRMLTDEMLEQK